jgi:hypothetical protein
MSRFLRISKNFMHEILMSESDSDIRNPTERAPKGYRVGLSNRVTRSNPLWPCWPKFHYFRNMICQKDLKKRFEKRLEFLLIDPAKLAMHCSTFSVKDHGKG